MEAVLAVQPAASLRQISWVSDLPAMLAIEKASFANPWSLLNFLCFAFKSGTSGRVRVRNGKVVGYILYVKQADRLHVAHVAVQPDCRSLGLGREMILSLADRARCYVTLHVRKGNLSAQRLYHRLGFEVVRELPHHYADCEDAFLMGFRGR
ncbi:ribosomal protein S18-alanine N-acetyltransferase [soil metagenome]